MQSIHNQSVSSVVSLSHPVSSNSINIHVAASITTISQIFNHIQTGEEEQDEKLSFLLYKSYLIIKQANQHYKLDAGITKVISQISLNLNDVKICLVLVFRDFLYLLFIFLSFYTSLKNRTLICLL